VEHSPWPRCAPQEVGSCKKGGGVHPGGLENTCLHLGAPPAGCCGTGADAAVRGACQALHGTAAAAGVAGVAGAVVGAVVSVGQAPARVGSRQGVMLPQRAGVRLGARGEQQAR